MFFFTLEGVLGKGVCPPMDAGGKKPFIHMRVLGLQSNQPNTQSNIRQIKVDYYGCIAIVASLSGAHVYLQSRDDYHCLTIPTSGVSELR